MTQLEAFTDERKPCQACDGSGEVFDLETLTVRRCRACLGSGREADRPDPEHTEIPF